MAYEDLQKVVYRAVTDREFFEALLKNAKTAVPAAGFKLSHEDLETLTRLLNSPPPITFDVSGFIRNLQALEPEDARQFIDMIPPWRLASPR